MSEQWDWRKEWRAWAHVSADKWPSPELRAGALELLAERDEQLDNVDRLRQQVKSLRQALLERDAAEMLSDDRQEAEHDAVISELYTRRREVSDLSYWLRRLYDLAAAGKASEAPDQLAAIERVLKAYGL